MTIWRVVVGEHSLSVSSGLEQYLFVSSYVMHPSYNSRTVENDISLIFVITIHHVLVVSSYPNSFSLVFDFS